MNIQPINIATFLLIGVLWGLNWPAVKFLLTEIPPLTLRAVSFTAAASILAVVVTIIKQPLRLKKDEALATSIVGVFLIFGFNVLTAFGQIFLESSKAAIIAYTMPSLTAVLATFYLRDRLGTRVVIALLVAMSGLAFLASENLTSLIENPFGPVIMIFAALSWALGNVGLKSRKWRLQPLPLTVWFFAFSSFATWPLVFIWEPIWQQNLPSLQVLATLTFHILGPMIVCYILWASYCSEASRSYSGHISSYGTCCGCPFVNISFERLNDLAKKCSSGSNHIFHCGYNNANC
ncbi:DMT family transporter [Paracoccaceae bacterium]|nr:DMT family transporter [Paracoccaceae bacterium]